METIVNEVLASLITILGIICIMSYFKLIRRNQHLSKHLNTFPGPVPSFPFGNAIDLAVESHEILNVFSRWHKQFNYETFRIWLGNRGWLIICDANIAQKILTSSVHIEKAQDVYDIMKPWLNTGLVTSNGTKWLHRRKLLTPAFHFKILDEFMEVFNEQADILNDILEKECCDDLFVDIFPYLGRCTLDTICETAMGKKLSVQCHRESAYLGAIHKISELILYRGFRPWLKHDFLWNLSGGAWKERKILKVLHEFTDSVIQERKLERKSIRDCLKEQETETSPSTSGKKRLAFLDLLLDVSKNGQVLSDSDIREEVDTFMFAGHDTTAANIVWTLFCLSSNPDCMVKVREELDSIFEEDRSRHVTKHDLSQMKYLDCCIKEAQRIFPSIFLIGRDIRRDIVLDDGRVIPTGTNAIIYIYLLHRNPKVFPDREEFRPVRFLLDQNYDQDERSPFAFIPFSAGPRNCIGQRFAMMTEKVILTKLFLNFTFEALENMKSIIPVPGLVTLPKDGMFMKLKIRD